MSLESIISCTHKEIAGSRSKNRLTVQISYALQLVMEYYSMDFLVMMDYIEDVSIIIDPNNPSSIHLYQVKTKQSDKQYPLSTVISEEWFQKLYKNAQIYGSHLGSASLVCNTDIVASGAEIFPNEKTALDEETIKSNISKIKKAIAKYQKINETDVDLSKFYFVRSSLSTKGHKKEVEQQFLDFLYEQDTDLQVATAKSIFGLIYEELDKRFNHEISEECTDINEIFSQKGMGSDKIKSIVSNGLAIQIPEVDKLFSEYHISSIIERRKLASQYRQIKIDMFANINVFLELKRKLFNLIDKIVQNGASDLKSVLDKTYSEACEEGFVPPAYSDENYLKMLIMIIAYKYSYGGENT